MAELRQKALWESASTAKFDQRARLAAEIAARALEPAEAFLSGRAEWLACELYRESIYWALRSLDAQARAKIASPPVAEVATSVELEWLWQRLPPEIMDSLNPPLLERVQRAFVQQSFVAFAELSPEEQAQTARELGQLAEGLLRVSGTSRQEIDRIWFQRMLRLGAIALVLVAVLVSLSFAKTWREASTDLATGKGWRTSSRHGGHGCRSPAQSCSESPDYFFHTKEEDQPWVEIDLGMPALVSVVRIENRQDCCAERAVPLLVEVSTDQRRYEQVARRDGTFNSWRAEFGPVPARYVRVRAARRTLLHLARIRVLEE